MKTITVPFPDLNHLVQCIGGEPMRTGTSLTERPENPITIEALSGSQGASVLVTTDDIGVLAFAQRQQLAMVDAV